MIMLTHVQFIITNGVDILGIDILRIDILGIDILALPRTFEHHPKHMFKLMDKKIIAFLR